MAIQRTVYLEEDLFLRIAQRKRLNKRSFSKEINAMLETLLQHEANERHASDVAARNA